MDESGAKMHRGARPNQVAMDRGERFRSFVSAKAAARGLFHDNDIAAEAGVSENTLRNWWNGKGLELGTLVAVAGVIDSSIFELLDVWQREGPVPQPAPDPMAKALSSLAKELRASRRQRDELEGRLQGLEEAVKLLAGLTGATLPVPPVRDGTTG